MIDADQNAAVGCIGKGFYHRNASWFTDSQEERARHLELAQSFAEKAIALEPKNDLSHYPMGRVHVGHKETELARVRFEKTKELNPSFSNVYVGGASELLYRDDTDGAIADIRCAMTMDPLHPDWLHAQLAWGLWQAMECLPALKSMKRMTRVNPRYPKISLSCCPDRVRCRGAPVTNLSHKASFQSKETVTPSNRGIKQVVTNETSQLLNELFGKPSDQP